MTNLMRAAEALLSLWREQGLRIKLPLADRRGTVSLETPVMAYAEWIGRDLAEVTAEHPANYEVSAALLRVANTVADYYAAGEGEENQTTVGILRSNAEQEIERAMDALSEAVMSAQMAEVVEKEDP